MDTVTDMCIHAVATSHVVVVKAEIQDFDYTV